MKTLRLVAAYAILTIGLIPLAQLRALVLVLCWAVRHLTTLTTRYSDTLCNAAQRIKGDR